MKQIGIIILLLLSIYSCKSKPKDENQGRKEKAQATEISKSKSVTKVAAKPKAVTKPTASIKTNVVAKEEVVSNDNKQLKEEKIAEKVKADTSEFTTKYFGIGKVKINYEDIVVRSNEDFSIDFYDSISAKKPSKNLTLKWTEENYGAVKAINNDFLKITDYDIYEPFYFLCFNCLQECDGFYEVIVNEKTHETMWIEKTSKVELYRWIEFFELMPGGVSQIDPKSNPVRVSPSDTAKVFPKFYDWVAIDIKGHWMHLKPLDISIEITGEGDINDRGWIRWRDDKKLLIKYYWSL